jgi:tRNA dimethylallyltransferase
MDIGSGKDLPDYAIKKPDGKTKKIKYHLIDVVDPKKEFNLKQYQTLAFKALKDVLTRHKLPIIVGGTGLYLQAVVDNYHLSDVKPDIKLREELELLDSTELYEKLCLKNKAFAVKLNNSDKNNKRHLIRYLEVLSGDLSYQAKTKETLYDFLILGLDIPKEILYPRILKRLHDRLEQQDMLGEIKLLHQAGVSWERLEGFGLEYRYLSFYLQDKMTYEEMTEKLFTAICQFAKRQKTWYRRWAKQGKKIHWIKDLSEAQKLIKDFLT